MEIALILAIIAAFLWAVTNYIDKFLISHVAANGDWKGLIVVSSLIAGVVLLPVFIVLTRLQVIVDPIALLLIFLAAITYIVGTIFYFIALNKNDTSMVVVMFQLMPVFSFFLGLIFLGETLSAKQIIGGIIVVLASMALTFESEHRKFSKSKLIALALMVASSLMYAVYFLLFRLTTLENDFNVMAFWFQISFLVTGLILLCVKPFRLSFKTLMLKNGKKTIALNAVNETLNLAGNLLVNFAILFAPMALVQTLNGFQPIFVFILGLILTFALPKLFKEDTSKHTIIQKSICILISFLGIALLYL